MLMRSLTPAGDADKSKFITGVALVTCPTMVSVPMLPPPCGPGDKMPPDLTETGLVMTPPPPSVAPELTMVSEGVLVPFSSSVPAETVFVLVKVFLPVNVSRPVPVFSRHVGFVMLRASLMTPAKVESVLLPPML